jgi:hypothetical protein
MNKVRMKAMTRYLDRSRLSFLERLLDAWFAPKPFVSPGLYKRMGVLFLKRYVPTGGDFFYQRFGVRIVEIQGNLDAMIHFERLTRVYETIHTIAFLAFMVFPFRRWRRQKTTFLDFLYAILVYVVLILLPAALQRYNRLRAYRAIRILAKKEKIGETEA